MRDGPKSIYSFMRKDIGNQNVRVLGNILFLILDQGLRSRHFLRGDYTEVYAELQFTLDDIRPLIRTSEDTLLVIVDMEVFLVGLS